MSIFWPKKKSFFFDFLKSPGFPRIPRPLPDQKKRENIKDIDFYEKSENRDFSGNRNFRVGGTRPEGPVKSAHHHRAVAFDRGAEIERVRLFRLVCRYNVLELRTGSQAKPMSGA